MNSQIVSRGMAQMQEHLEHATMRELADWLKGRPELQAMPTLAAAYGWLAGYASKHDTVTFNQFMGASMIAIQPERLIELAAIAEIVYVAESGADFSKRYCRDDGLCTGILAIFFVGRIVGAKLSGQLP